MPPKKKSLPPELDPIFPIVAGFEIPPVRQGEGRQITKKRTETVVVEIPYRAFYFLWEYAEREGGRQYPKYVGGPLDHVAQTWLDAVWACRSAAAGVPLKRFPEDKAKKAREILARVKAKAAAAAKAKRNGSEEAPEAPQRPSKARKATKAVSGTRKTRRKA